MCTWYQICTHASTDRSSLGCTEGNLCPSKSRSSERIASNARIFDFTIDQEDMDLLDTLNQNYHQFIYSRRSERYCFLDLLFSQQKPAGSVCRRISPVLYLSNIFFDFFSLCHSTTEASEPLLFCHGSSDHALHLMPACLQKVLYSLP